MARATARHKHVNVTDEEVSLIYEKEGSYHKAAKYINKTYSVDITSGWTRERVKQFQEVQAGLRHDPHQPSFKLLDHPKPDLGELPSKKVNVMGMLKQAAERANGHNSDNKDYRKITIETDKPIAVIKSADWHFGGLDISYGALAQHLKFLWKASRFYMQLFGDDLNLMVSHPNVAARHDIFTPDEQCAFLENFVDETLTRGKLLSMGWGNHSDEFTERTAGFGIVKSLVKHKVPYFRGMGYIDLVVGKQTYPIAFAHKVRFNSFMNPTHGNKRMEQLHAEWFGPNRPIAREYITAHTHNPALSMEGAQPDDRIYYIKCGTFKTNCVYSQRYFGQGRIGCPTVVYHPDRFEHVAFPTPWEAYRYMNGKDWRG
jgi:hypothetical protein